MKIPWSWILILFLVVNIVMLARSQWVTLNPENVNISEQEAKELVEERYQGIVKKIELSNQLYHIEFEKENTSFVIKLDSLSGGLISYEKDNG